jgi:hypothetical protein
MSVLAHELSTHIFQPTFVNLLKGSKDLGDFLVALTRVNADLESHLRSVLLKASDTLRAATKGEPIDKVCSNAVVSSVKDLMLPAILEADRRRFEIDLQDLCKTACQQWGFIQTLEDRVMCDPGSDWDSKRKYEWEPFAFPVSTPSAAVSPKQQRVNGTASAPGQQQKNSHSSASQPLADAVDLDKGVAVWPVFYNLSTLDEETLARGLILPAALIRAAEEEQKAMSASTTSLGSSMHRDQRQKSRRHSLVNGQIGESKDRRGSFLSNGSGGGGKGA